MEYEVCSIEKEKSEKIRKIRKNQKKMLEKSEISIAV
jgi:hypothetical protein